MYHHVFMFLFTPGMGVNRARRAYIIIYKGACAPSVPRAMSCHFEHLKNYAVFHQSASIGPIYQPSGGKEKKLFAQRELKNVNIGFISSFILYFFIFDRFWNMKGWKTLPGTLSDAIKGKLECYNRIIIGVWWNIFMPAVTRKCASR